MSILIDRWTGAWQLPEKVLVLPDGCRDVIVSRPSSGRPCWFVSGLDLRPRYVDVGARTRMTGYRLRPGVAINTAGLNAALAEKIDDDDRLSSVIEENCSIEDGLNVAIWRLAGTAANVSAAARDIGISQRSLQRLFERHRMPRPEFWLQLGRVRRAAALVLSDISLADAAYAAGFSDQPHMTREFRRWLGCTPGDMRTDSATWIKRFQPGLETIATGEHISTK